MSNKWRRKHGSEAKPDETAEAVWGDDDDAGTSEHPSEPEPVEAEAGGTKHTAEASTSTPDSPATASGAAGVTEPPAPGEAPAGQAQACAAGASPPPAATEAAPATSTRAGDEFDVLGAEIADVLRHTREVADRVRAEAEEHARAITAEAEQRAQATIADAEHQARDHRAEAEREIEEQRTEVARQLDEAAGVLEAATRRDLELRNESEKHLADAVAARDEGRAILEQATERLNRAQTVAQELAAQIEAARLEVAPLATELQAQAEQYSAVVLKEKAATAHLGDVGDDPSVIDLRDAPGASGSSPEGTPVEPAADASVGQPETSGGDSASET